MKFAIQVNGHPGSSQAADTAYQFIKAALLKNHQVTMVFFYYDGVLNSLPPSPSSGPNQGTLASWTALAIETGVDLVVCVSAAERRGLSVARDNGSLPDGFSQLAPGFRLGGLGQWVDACLRCDRFITFAA